MELESPTRQTLVHISPNLLRSSLSHKEEKVEGQLYKLHDVPHDQPTAPSSPLSKQKETQEATSTHSSGTRYSHTPVTSRSQRKPEDLQESKVTKICLCQTEREVVRIQ